MFYLHALWSINKLPLEFFFRNEQPGVDRGGLNLLELKVTDQNLLATKSGVLVATQTLFLHFQSCDTIRDRKRQRGVV